MTATRTYRIQMLAMLSTGGQRPRFDHPQTHRRQPAVSLHRCGDVLAIRANSSYGAAFRFDDATMRSDVAPEWTRAFYRTHRGHWVKPGDVLAVDGQPTWQNGHNDYHLIPPEQRPHVAALIAPLSWRDTLCPFDAAVEHGRRPRGLVAINLQRSELNVVHRALTDTTTRPDDPTSQFVERQAVAHLRRRPAFSERVILRLAEAHIDRITQVLLAAAGEHEQQPSPTFVQASWAHADGLRALLRRIQTQAAAQALEAPSPRDPAVLDLSW
jgi:hypothetical protein